MLAVLGCVPEPPTADTVPLPEVSIAPLSGRRALPVVRLRVHAAPATLLEPEDLGLFTGPLSDYHVGRIAKRDLPETLLERRVPVVRFRDPTSADLVVAPERALVPGESYSLVTPSFGRLAEFEVASAESLPLLERVWPPSGYPGADYALFCGERAPTAPLTFELEPGEVAAHGVPLLTDTPERPCLAVRFEARAVSGSELVFPAALAGFAFDPEPFRIEMPTELVARVCDASERRLGPGCARVEDDRLIVAGPEAPLLWQIAGENGVGIRPARSGAPFAVRGLTPATRQRLLGIAVGADGVEHPFDVFVETTAARARLVLNEVLANPLGPERALLRGHQPSRRSDCHKREPAPARERRARSARRREALPPTRRLRSLGVGQHHTRPGARRRARPDGRRSGGRGHGKGGHRLWLGRGRPPAILRERRVTG